MKYNLTTESDKKEICNWQYPDEYAIYNFSPYEELLKNKQSFCNPARKKNFYSYYDGETLVGFTNIFEEENKVFIGIGVNSQYCNQGYGRMILDTAYKISKELYPLKPLYLEVRTWNKRAINCYKKAGFVIEKKLRKTTTIGEGEFYRMIRK